MNTRKILALVISLAMIFSCIPFTLGVSAADATASTLPELISVMSANTASDITIALTANITVSAASILPARTGNTIITSNDPANPATITLGSGKSLTISSDVTFKDVKFAVANTTWTNWHQGQWVGKLVNGGAGVLTLDGVNAPYLSVFNSRNDGGLVSTVVTGDTTLGALFLGGSSGGTTAGTKVFNAFVKVEDGSKVTDIILGGDGSWNENAGNNLDGNLIVAVDNATVSNIYASARWEQVKVLGDYYTYVTNGGVITSDTMVCEGTKYTNANSSITTDGTIASISAAPVLVGGKYVLGFDIVKAGGVAAEALLYNGDSNLSPASGNTYLLNAGTAYTLGFRVPVAGAHTIYFVGGEGATGSTDPIEVAAETNVVLPAGGFRKAGYYCSGWNDGNDTYAVGADYTMPDNDVTMNAVWTEVTALYVDGVNGDDATADLNPAHPFKTIGAALAAFPTGNITVKLKSALTFAPGTVVPARADDSTVTIISDLEATGAPFTITVAKEGNASNSVLASDVVFMDVNIRCTTAGNQNFPVHDYFGGLNAQKNVTYVNVDASSANLFLGANTNGAPRVDFIDSTLGALWLGNHGWGAGWDLNGDVTVNMMGSRITNLVLAGAGYDNYGASTINNLNLYMIDSAIGNAKYFNAYNGTPSAIKENFNLVNVNPKGAINNALFDVAGAFNSYNVTLTDGFATVKSVAADKAELALTPKVAGATPTINGAEAAPNTNDYYEIYPGNTTIVFTVEYGEDGMIFVDATNGDDEFNNGTREKPLKTIAGAMAAVPEGDITVALLSGVTLAGFSINPYNPALALPERDDDSVLTITSGGNEISTVHIGTDRDQSIIIGCDVVFDNIRMVAENAGASHFPGPNYFASLAPAKTIKFVNCDASGAAVFLSESAYPIVELENSNLAALWIGKHAHGGSWAFTGDVEVVLKDSSIATLGCGGLGWDNTGATTINGNLKISADNSTINRVNNTENISVTNLNVVAYNASSIPDTIKGITCTGNSKISVIYPPAEGATQSFVGYDEEGDPLVIEVDPENNFVVDGLQLRTKGEQALRFISKIAKSQIASVLEQLGDEYVPNGKAKDGELGFGFVVIPTLALGESELVKDGVYTLSANEYAAMTVPAAYVFNKAEYNNGEVDYYHFSVALNGIDNAHYKVSFTVRPYITFNSPINGEQVTVYGDSCSCSIAELAEQILEQNPGSADAIYVQQNISPYLN